MLDLLLRSMQKNTITIIVVVMSLALLGIILLQINWIKHDFILKEQQFDQQVSEAMHETVEKLETQQALSFISSRFFNYQGDSTFWKSLDSSVAKIPAEIPNVEEVDTLSELSQLPPEPVTYSVTENENEIEIIDSIKIGDKTRREQINIKSGSDNLTTDINHLRISEELLKQEKMEMRNEVMQAEVEKQRIRTEQDLIRMKVKVNSKVEKLNEVMGQLALSFVTDENNSLRSASPAMVDSVLKSELKNRGISTAYNFGILDSKKDSLISIKDSSGAEHVKKSKYGIDLYPNELISRGQLLQLFFPSRTVFVLSSMTGMLLGSALLTLTIILVFFYTVNILMKQKQLSDIKSDFINNMTHEFKTPIATISLAIDAINNPKISSDSEKVMHYSNIIREENKRMNKQVETILQTALFEKKDFKLNKKEIDLHELIRKAAENIMVQVESRGGTIEIKLDATEYKLQADEVLMVTAIVNLLDNANKYSPDKPEIKINTANRENGILISVEDRGMGMSKEIISKIFEKFYRQASGNVHDIKGFGLGLSNVKAIVAAHRGEIKVTSESGKGSRFDVFLPIEKNENTE